MKVNWLSICLASLISSLLGNAEEGAQSSATFSREHFEIDGQTAFVILPTLERTKESKSIPWVLYAPTFTGRLPSDRDEGWMMQRWLDQGIAIAGIDIGESYGSPAGRQAYTKLHKKLVEQFRFDPKASLLARSRGGLMLYCWAVENPEKVRCIAGIYPVCDLSSYPGIEKACGAYAMTAEELKAKLHLHNPIPRLAPLAKAQVPILHIHGAKDKLVPLAANSAAVKEEYDRLGGSMKLIVAPDQWHNMWRGFFECQELVDFVIQKALTQAQ